MRQVVELERGATWWVDVKRRERRVLICRAGRVWVTREGDRRDYFLRAGDRLELRGGRRVVVEALAPAAVEWA